MKNIIILISILFVSCQTPVKETETNTAENDIVTLNAAQLKNTSIQTGDYKIREIANVLKLNGLIDVPPQNMISVSVPLGGYLKNTKLLPGMHVNKGEQIATLEDQLYVQIQQDYLTTKVKLLYAQKELERQKTMNQNKASSDKAYQMAIVDQSSLKIELKALGEKLKIIGLNPLTLTEENISRLVPIISPINGYVTSIKANIGKYLSANDVLFELVNPEDIHLALKVFEKDLDKTKIGQQLLAYTNNNTSIKYPCQIILIGKELGQDRSAIVHCHFDKYDKTLIPGMFMNAEIAINAKQATTIETDAIVSFENKHYVFVELAKGKYKMIEINLGHQENGFSEINVPDEIKNKKIVIAGAYQLLMTLKNTEE
jgi:cobalt-zinc-cadmium efflux system membrane fusion protein